jgi:O-Antigen ligase
MANDLVADPVPATAYRPARPKRSAIHKAALMLVWLTAVSSAFVFVEPAPFDILSMSLFVLLPVIGLVAWKPAILAGFELWLVTAAFGAISATRAADLAEAVKHTSVSLYLYGLCFIMAVFIAKRPGPHTRLVLNALLVASVMAAILGIAGFLDLVPGASDNFTRYGRASGPFKDPNVYGPFLVTGLIIALHLWLTRPVARGLGPMAIAAVLTIGILFSFSRGAWAAAAAALGLYCYLYMLTSRHDTERLKLALTVIMTALATGLMVAVAVQSDSVADLLQDRAAITQTYDEGPDGRFGGQAKAFALMLDNPLGIGAHQFSPTYHHEEPHNVYLSMALNNGWGGGALYLLITAATLVLGFGHALKNTRCRGLFLIVYAALAANMFEGVIIDSDHWRHVYMLMGIAWGLMAADNRELRSARIIADRRPTLMQHLLLVPPTRRAARIVGRVPARIPSGRAVVLGGAAQPTFERRRPKIARSLR